MATRTYTRSNFNTLNPAQLGEQIDVALGRTGTEVNVHQLEITVTHAALVAGDDAQINSLITAYVFNENFVPAAEMLSSRVDAQLLLLSQSPIGKAIRGLMDVLLDEINLIRKALVHPVTSITRTTTVATATTPAPHGLNNGDSVAIFGATLAAYNGIKTVASTPTTTTFTYTVTGSPATPAVGTIIYAMDVVPATPPRTLLQLKDALTAAIVAGLAD
jgi:hypothetical protein